jgi:hypothetical protein
MNEMTATPATTRDATGGRWFTTAVVLVGPALTVAALASKVGTIWLRPDQAGLILAIALLFWCPAFFSSVPALLTQDGRDRALPELNGLAGSSARTVILVPWLILSPTSTVRVETAASVIGFVVGVITALSIL